MATLKPLQVKASAASWQRKLFIHFFHLETDELALFKLQWHWHYDLPRTCLSSLVSTLLALRPCLVDPCMFTSQQMVASLHQRSMIDPRHARKRNTTNNIKQQQAHHNSFLLQSNPCRSVWLAIRELGFGCVSVLATLVSYQGSLQMWMKPPSSNICDRAQAP